MALFKSLFSYLYQEKINLCEILIYCSIGVYTASGLGILLGQNRFFKTLKSLRLALRFYFTSFVSCTVIYGAAFFIATGEVASLTLALLFFFGLTIQIQSEILNDPRLPHGALHRISIQAEAIRHWVLILLGLGILLGLNRFLSTFLLLVAQKQNFSVLNKDLILWLRAPIAIYAAQLITEFLRTYLLRFDLRAIPIENEENPLLKSIKDIGVKYHLQIKNVFLINLDKYNYNLIFGHKSNIFLNSHIKKIFSEKEFEFLIVQGLVDKKLKLERQRLGHYTIFAIGLFLPYFLLGQGLDYIVPNIWALTIWQLLFVCLFIAQSLLKKDIDSLQFALKCHAARKLVKISGAEIGEIYRKINNLNQVELGPPVIFGLPRPPSLGGAKEKYLAKVQSNLRGHLGSLTMSAQVLTASTLFLLGVSVFTLGPRYQMRLAAEKGDLTTILKMLTQGQSPNSIDILSNVTPTPLLAASQAGQNKIVKVLLDHGADPNQRVPLPFSPLILAAKDGNIELVQMLISSGAHINYHGYKGLTPLMWAALLNRKEIAIYLIEHGASINARSNHKSTALMLAAQAGSLDVAKLLINSGADIRLLDADKDSVLTLAKKKKSVTLVELIESNEQKGLGVARLPSSKYP